MSFIFWTRYRTFLIFVFIFSLYFVELRVFTGVIHLSGSRLYGLVLVYGMADSCLYNKQNNTWTLGDMEFIFSCSHSISHSFAALTRSISMWTLEHKFHISARPCIILYIIRKDRSRSGGGVALYIWENLSYTNRIDLVPHTLEMICAEINLPHSRSFLVST